MLTSASGAGFPGRELSTGRREFPGDSEHCTARSRSWQEVIHQEVFSTLRNLRSMWLAFFRLFVAPEPRVFVNREGWRNLEHSVPNCVKQVDWENHYSIFPSSSARQLVS